MIFSDNSKRLSIFKICKPFNYDELFLYHIVLSSYLTWRWISVTLSYFFCFNLLNMIVFVKACTLDSMKKEEGNPHHKSLGVLIKPKLGMRSTFSFWLHMCRCSDISVSNWILPSHTPKHEWLPWGTALRNTFFLPHKNITASLTLRILRLLNGKAKQLITMTVLQTLINYILNIWGKNKT